MPGTESLIEVEEQKASDERAQRRAEAIAHPLRRAIDETFGGSWQEPVLDGDKP